MHTKDDQAYATLTDVKNKTGDVFALADEFGEVTITSYNKSKYLIKRLTISHLPAATVVTEEVIAAEPVPEPELVAVVPGVVETAAEAPAVEPLIPETPVEPESVLPAVEPPLTVETNPPAPPVDQTEPGQSSREIVGIFAGVGADSLWDRNQRREQDWVKDTHRLI